MKSVTYKNSGVDIAKASAFKQKIKGLVRASFTGGVLADIGGFGSFFELPRKGFKQPVLVSSADGVGTKLKIAALAGIHDSVGIDAVAMNVNDILCVGARPLFFLDYIAFSCLRSEILVSIVKGLNKGCIQAGCALIGGETAQMPDMYAYGEYDIAGFCVGIVDKAQRIDGSKIRAGDAIIGLASNGLHSNGYSLVRKVLSPDEQRRMSGELLKPTRIYVKPVQALLDTVRASVHGIAHITGGAFYDKIARILPGGITARIRKNTWCVPDIFKLVQSKGHIDDKEMYHTLNMGIGMVVFIPRDAVAPALRILKQCAVNASVIGEAVKGNRQVEVL